ncbi:MAG: carboxylate-amine ligase [Acidimicrobiia bacterium]|nr:carboxylate-amine ligase [Acidimicrobiia bacterium]
MPQPSFTIGIEEEYLIVDLETRELVREAPEGLMADCKKVLGNQASPEFLQSQIEVGTNVCSSIGQLRQVLTDLRLGVAEVTGRYWLAPMAASTHPFADWSQQMNTDAARYNDLAEDLKTVVRRLVTSGMHIHIGLDDDNLRIDYMNQASYFLPHLLALSTSSPFWEGSDSGLKSYRMPVFRALPRTGIPPAFTSWGEYQRHVDILVDAGVIEDATKIWWDLRPSARYPTLESRITDIPTRLEDSLAIGALFRSIMHMLDRLRRDNRRWRQYSEMLIEENVWRAERYGIDKSLIDFGKGELVPFAELANELVELVREDAEELDCVAELEHVATIANHGTSADRQLDVYAKSIADGRSNHEALCDVVDLLVKETVKV